MSVLRATSFRAAFGFIMLLMLVLGLVLSLLYKTLETRLTTAEEARIWREAANLNRYYTQGGVQALGEAVTAAATTGQGLGVQLSDRLGIYLAGNLTRFPAPEATENKADGWFDFTTPQSVYHARFVPLDEDLVLLLGFDRRDLDGALADMQARFALTLIGLTLIGLIGAAALAHRNLARIGEMNRHMQPVLAGVLDTRLPVGARGDEWALLAGHINVMLARLEKLVDATREVSDNLAHDLRAPLTRLKMRLEALMEGAQDDQLDQLGDALEDIDALLRSFNALLALSRLESGTTKLNRVPIDVPALFEKLAGLFEAVFEDAAMTLHVDGAAVAVSGDEALLSQAIANGLENALAHGARADAHVRLMVRDAGSHIEMEIADQGPGIAAADRSRAVARFVRLDDSRSGDGTGLGMSLVAAICHHHGGGLVLEDNAPGLRLIMQLPKAI